PLDAPPAYSLREPTPPIVPASGRMLSAPTLEPCLRPLQTAAGECIIGVSRRVIRRPTLPSIRRAARLIRRPASGAGRPLASLAPRPASWLALAAPLLFTAWLASGAG